MKRDFTGIVPAQYTGEEIEAEASINLDNEYQAKKFYLVAKERLLNVNNWHKLAGVISAHFQLTDNTGKEIGRQMHKGDFLKIDIPGPGNKDGDGYDWVCIEEIKEMSDANIQSTGFRVRPAKNPDGEKKDTAHFYSDESTSNFIVTREGKQLTAQIIDRNIKPNEHAHSLTGKIRDTAVGMSAIGMFSKIQWQILAEGIVKQDV
ncbi:MAG: hypothetical protein ABIT96_03310 [Ferruginibacter sp.]